MNPLWSIPAGYVFAALVLPGLGPTALASPSVPLAAEVTSINDGDAPALPRVEILSAADDRIVLEFRLDSFESKEVSVGGRSFQSIAIPGGGMSGEPRQPELPIFSRLLAIPAGSAPVVSVSVLEVEELPGWALPPAREDGPAPPGTQSAFWDGRNDAGRDVGAGVYFTRLDAGGRRAVQKIVRVR